MKVLVSGSTGLIGTALLDVLPRQGHEVVRLVRPATRVRTQDPKPPAGQTNVAWNPETGTLDPGADGTDAIIHLAGASIAGGRWTSARKDELRDSRIATTRQLIVALGKLPRPPKVFIAASAIGFYGSRDDEELTESSAPGTDFLAHLARGWEAESARAGELGARVAILRLGVILAKQGGALPQMALPFRLGVGGRVGSGQQWMSWIALEDVVGIIRSTLANAEFAGPINVVSPQPVRNAEFAVALAHALHRPALFPTPGFVLRLALGEMADALLLSSQRVLPKRLEQLDYSFEQPELEPALASIFGGPR